MLVLDSFTWVCVCAWRVFFCLNWFWMKLHLAVFECGTVVETRIDIDKIESKDKSTDVCEHRCIDAMRSNHEFSSVLVSVDQVADWCNWVWDFQSSEPLDGVKMIPTNWDRLFLVQSSWHAFENWIMTKSMVTCDISNA